MIFKSIVTVFLLSFNACKSPNSVSESKSVVTTNGSNFIVYYKDGDNRSGTVYRSTCNNLNQVSSPLNCQVNKSKDWLDFKSALQDQGVSLKEVNSIRTSLEGTSKQWDGTNDKSLIKRFEKAFDYDTNATDQVFDQVFVGGSSPLSGPQIPTPNTQSIQLAKSEILTEMGRVRSSRSSAVTTTVIQDCLDNSRTVTNWSDVVFHYYCQFGNLRSCFTSNARANSKDYQGYEKAYDTCASTNAEFQQFISNDPKTATLFKHVMFSVYSGGGLNTFAQNDEDEVINSFYGVSNPLNSTECSKRPYLDRPTSHPKYRSKGQHCSNTQPTTPPPTNQNTTCTNGGIAIGGGCWFLSNLGESCDDVCGSKSLLYSDLTDTYAGGRGTLANCNSLADAFNIGPKLNQSSSNCGNSGCIFCTGSCSSSWIGVWHCASPTISSSKRGLYRRFCACK